MSEESSGEERGGEDMKNVVCEWRGRRLRAKKKMWVSEGGGKHENMLIVLDAPGASHKHIYMYVFTHKSMHTHTYMIFLGELIQVHCIPWFNKAGAEVVS